MCVEYVQSGNQQTISPCVPEEDDKNDLMTVVLDSRIVCDCISTFYLQRCSNDWHEMCFCGYGGSGQLNSDGDQ